LILLDKIVIKDFRGIRDLTVDLGGKSYAICGPNGTGKSGVVDAIEFGLTGSISRLTGSGRGELSLSKHAPHVDSRNSPEKAKVILTVRIPSLEKTVTIERSVQGATAPRIDSEDPQVLEVLQYVATHPEFVLSRRELIKYVLATPGERAQEVSALLHLNQVEQVRGRLQKIANAAERAAKQFSSSAADSRSNLLRALGIGSLSRESVLSAANAKRAILGLAALTELSQTTSLKDGVVTLSGKAPRIAKAQALEDLKQLRDALGEINDETKLKISSSRDGVQGLLDDPVAAGGLQRERFLRAGLALAEAEACPLCDTAWDLAELKAHLQRKIEKLEQAAGKRRAVESNLAPLLDFVGRFESLLGTVIPLGARLPVPEQLKDLKSFKNQLAVDKAALGALLPLAEALAAIDRVTVGPNTIESDLAAIEKGVAALPDPSSEEAAKDWLSVSQERLESYREARRKEVGAQAQAAAARTIADAFATTSDAVLTGIYKAVEKDFAALYASINPDDEAAFRAELTPSMGKLGFGVDFYGRGLFPPGAYHNEGHQDGMGLCLYLSLMRYLQGDNFKLAVLDDVLMSVDVGHRREVCKLLKTQFPGTQFIVTTHDRIWLKHMATEGVIGPGASLNFRRWEVGQGPTQWDDRDVWAEIEANLEDDKVHNAASCLRNYLEYMSGELCHALRAEVEYRGDAQYQLGELLPSAIGRLGDVLKAGRAAAESWKQGDVAASLGERKRRLAEAVSASRVEQWQVNTAIHYNAWDNLTRNDFRPVAKAMRELLTHFTCPDCHGLLRAVPDRETVEVIRCDCGKVSINQKKRPS